jgi:hypothetical protein
MVFYMCNSRLKGNKKCITCLRTWIFESQKFTSLNRVLDLRQCFSLVYLKHCKDKARQHAAATAVHLKDFDRVFV